jgi:hypothetical protein
MGVGDVHGSQTEHTPMKDILPEQFDQLSDDSLVTTKIAARVLSASVWTLYRSSLRRVQISQRRIGFRVGDIRALVRGERPAA